MVDEACWCCPECRGEQRLECLSHRFALIQVHAQVALWFRQSKQASSNRAGLFALACLVQRHQILGEKGDGDRDIGRSIQVLAPAFQQFQRLPPAQLCEIHPDHDRESVIQAIIP